MITVDENCGQNGVLIYKWKVKRDRQGRQASSNCRPDGEVGLYRWN